MAVFQGRGTPWCVGGQHKVALATESPMADYAHFRSVKHVHVNSMSPCTSRSQQTGLYFTFHCDMLKLKLSLAVHAVTALPLNYGQLRIGFSLQSVALAPVSF